MLKRIALTGPESTGKSWLAERLADHFETVWVKEYARTYLKEKGTDYTFDDVLTIARQQKQQENRVAGKANRLLFCDTEPIVTKIWCDVVYNKTHPWILNEIKNHPYDLYLLCYPDIDWEPDVLRENPHNRLELFELYKKELETRHLNYRIIKGEGNLRFDNAVKTVNQFLKQSKS